MDIPKQFGILLLENNYGGYIGTITAVMAGQVECSFCGGVGRCQVDFIPRSGSRSSTQIDWGEIFVRLRKENQGSPFPEITSEMAFAECILDHIINFMSN